MLEAAHWLPYSHCMQCRLRKEVNKRGGSLDQHVPVARFISREVNVARAEE